MPETGFDDWIDAQLRSVPLPANLLARLAASGPAAARDDAPLDAALRNVPVPATLEVRLRRIARSIPAVPFSRQAGPFWRQAAFLRQVGLAASVFLAIGLGGIGFIGLYTGALGPAPRQITKSQKSAPVANNAASSARVVVPNPIDEPVPLATVDEPIVEPGTNVAVDDAQAPIEDVAMTPEDSAEAAALAAKPRAPSALGAGGTLDRLPDLDTFDAPLARGMVPPLVRGYDLMFQLKYGEHPLVSPAAHADLAATKMPFAFDTASYDLALAAIRAGALPLADEIRVEDFLAAHDYGLPEAPPAGLALNVAASPSPLGDTTRHVLQLALQAASFDRQTHAPNRLIVAVDASAQMRGGARLDAVRRGLAKLADHMQDGDRVTLVLFGERTTVLTKAAGATELKTLAATGVFSEPSGPAHLSDGVRAAWEAARDMQSMDPRHVVVITGERGNYDAAAMAESTGQLGELGQMNVPWQIIRVAAADNDAHWEELAEKARGKVLPARSPADVYDALLEALINYPTPMANDVTLSLKFNPQVVAGYRLMGHEARTLTGVSPQPLTVTLRADQTAVALYEMTLKPDTGIKPGATVVVGEGELVCSAEVTWQHPPTKQPQRIFRPLGRKQFAGSFATAPPWLQEAVVVAKAAEVLRGSYYAPTSRGLGQVLDVAGQVDPRVAEGPDFLQLVEALKRAEKLR